MLGIILSWKVNEFADRGNGRENFIWYPLDQPAFMVAFPFFNGIWKILNLNFKPRNIRQHLLTPCSWLGQQFLYYVVIRRLPRHPRVLHKLLLDGYANVILCQQVLKLFKGLQIENVRSKQWIEANIRWKSTLRW